MIYAGGSQVRAVERPAKRVRHLALGEVLGSSTFGDVREALDLRCDRVVAVKCYKRRLLRSVRDGELQLRRENETLRTMPSCPSLPRADHVDLLDDPRLSRVYLAMEYVDGESLLRLVQRAKRHTLPFGTQLRSVFYQTLEALQALHDSSVAHRDISPANVIVSGCGARQLPPPAAHSSSLPPSPVRATLIDFGNAVALDADEHTRQRSAAGALVFQAPEVVRQERGVDLAKADVWSLGMTMYVCVLGRPPYRSDHLMQQLEQVRAGAYDDRAIDALRDADAAMLRAMLHIDAAKRCSAQQAMTYFQESESEASEQEEQLVLTPAPAKEDIIDRLKRVADAPSRFMALDDGDDSD